MISSFRLTDDTEFIGPHDVGPKSLGVIVVIFMFVFQEIGTFGGKYIRRNRVWNHP